MNKIEIISTIIASVAIILGGVWFIIEKAINSGVNKHRLDNLEKSCSQLPEKTNELRNKIEALPCNSHMDNIIEYRGKVESHIEKHGSVENSITRIETSIEFMQKSIDSFSQSLQKNKGLILDQYTQSKSPLSITEKGQEMSERIGLLDMFEENWNRIMEIIETNSESKNPYDIQQFCIEQSVVFPEKFINEDQLNKIKIDAYNTGISLTSYMKVIAVYARDKYFKEKSINVDDVDIYDPNK